MSKRPISALIQSEFADYEWKDTDEKRQILEIIEDRHQQLMDLGFAKLAWDYAVKDFLTRVNQTLALENQTVAAELKTLAAELKNERSPSILKDGLPKISSYLVSNSGPGGNKYEPVTVKVAPFTTFPHLTFIERRAAIYERVSKFTALVEQVLVDVMKACPELKDLQVLLFPELSTSG